MSPKEAETRAELIDPAKEIRGGRESPPMLPPELSRCLTSGHCVAFIGSGLSEAIYGGWVDLVNALCEQCGSETRVGKTTTAEELLDAAEDARSSDIDKYHSYLGDHFGRIALTNPLYDLVMRIPFKSYITVNLDPLLAEEARKPEHRCNAVMQYPHLDRAAIDNRTLYYAHGLINEGTVPTPGTIVLSRSEFITAYANDSPLKNFLLETLRYDPLCFIGCRLAEPEFRRVFEICKEQQDELVRLAGGSRPPRFILLRKVEVWSEGADGLRQRDSHEEDHKCQEEDDFYAGFGIKVIRYEPKDRYHTGLLQLMQPLAHLSSIPRHFGFNGGPVDEH